ncbi:hypothetical protein N309_15544, partial [Tinamus guttatus]
QVSRDTSTGATSVQSKKTLYLRKTRQACRFPGRHTRKTATTARDARSTRRQSHTVHRNAH